MAHSRAFPDHLLGKPVSGIRESVLGIQVPEHSTQILHTIFRRNKSGRAEVDLFNTVISRRPVSPLHPVSRCPRFHAVHEERTEDGEVEAQVAPSSAARTTPAKTKGSRVGFQKHLVSVEWSGDWTTGNFCVAWRTFGVSPPPLILW